MQASTVGRYRGGRGLFLLFVIPEHRRTRAGGGEGERGHGMIGEVLEDRLDGITKKAADELKERDAIEAWNFSKEELQDLTKTRSGFWSKLYRHSVAHPVHD